MRLIVSVDTFGSVSGFYFKHSYCSAHTCDETHLSRTLHQYHELYHLYAHTCNATHLSRTLSSKYHELYCLHNANFIIYVLICVCRFKVSLKIELDSRCNESGNMYEYTYFEKPFCIHISRNI